VHLGVRAALIDGDVVPGDIRVEDGRIAAVGLEPNAGAAGLAVPGFVDAHINGFAGVDFLGDDAPDYERAGLALAATGVTAYLPTFVTAAPAHCLQALAALPGPDDGPGARVLGAHLEGPFIATRWAGAHDRVHVREPDRELMAELCAAGPVRLVTLAPELPGAMELIDDLVAVGVVVSCGHSDADAATAHRAYDRGARAITHIYNAHRRWQPRDPGLAGAALARDDVFVQMILDDVHLAPETAVATFRASGDRLCLVTDAIAAAGSVEGPSTLGDQTVSVVGEAARLADGTLAGSVLTLDRAVRNLVRAGASLADAIHAASRAPALLLGRPDLGRIAVGAHADVAVLDDDLHVDRTYVYGQVVPPAVRAARPGTS
jgi:N-acetylglucosamine-6-phosphate deacetylase